MPKVIIKLSRRAEFRGRKTLERTRSLCILDNSSPPSSWRSSIGNSLVSSSNSLIYRASKSKKRKREREKKGGEKGKSITDRIEKKKWDCWWPRDNSVHSRIFLEVTWYEEVRCTTRKTKTRAMHKDIIVGWRHGRDTSRLFSAEVRPGEA